MKKSDHCTKWTFQFPSSGDSNISDLAKDENEMKLMKNGRGFYYNFKGTYLSEAIFWKLSSHTNPKTSNNMVDVTK